MSASDRVPGYNSLVIKPWLDFLCGSPSLYLWGRHLAPFTHLEVKQSTSRGGTAWR